MISVFCSTDIFTFSLSKPGMSNRRLRLSSVSFASHPLLPANPNPPPGDDVMNGFSMNRSIMLKIWLKLLVGETGSNMSASLRFTHTQH
ncbi:hypothetical protein Hanom_Chr03g00269871 [Helianthus anomalus]